MLGLNDIQGKAGEALRLASAKSMEAMLKAPTSANIASYDKARKALEAYEQEQAQGKAGDGSG